MAVSAGYWHTVGLKADGTVVAAGKNNLGQCDVAGWKDIVAVSAGDHHTVGLKADGTVVATKYTGDQISYGGQCDVAGWKLFKTEQEKEMDYFNACQWQRSGTTGELNRALSVFRELKYYKDSAERAKACSILLLNAEKTNLKTELTNLKGLFSGRRRKQIEARLAEIENELKSLK